MAGSQIPTLHTSRLILRPFQLSDAADVARLAGDFGVADTTAAMPHPYEPHKAEEWIASHEAASAEGREMALAVTLRDTGELAGAIGLRDWKSVHRHADIGYWIGRPHWGNGYATEAARALVAYGFETLDLHRIFAHHFKRNPASGRVLEKVGMKCEGCHREHMVRWGKFEDAVCYGILRSEFDAQPR